MRTVASESDVSPPPNLPHTLRYPSPPMSANPSLISIQAPAAPLLIRPPPPGGICAPIDISQSSRFPDLVMSYRRPSARSTCRLTNRARLSPGSRCPPHHRSSVRPSSALSAQLPVSRAIFLTLRSLLNISLRFRLLSLTTFPHAVSPTFLQSSYPSWPLDKFTETKYHHSSYLFCARGHPTTPARLKATSYAIQLPNNCTRDLHVLPQLLHSAQALQLPSTFDPPSM